MNNKRLPPQIKRLKTGQKLRFIRDTYDGDVWYRKNRVVYVLNVSFSVTLMGLITPLRDIEGHIDGAFTFQQDGFKHCRCIDNHYLVDNCEVIWD